MFARILGVAILIFALVLGVAPRAQSAGHDMWNREIDALTANDATQPPPKHGVVFVGSSSIRMWTSVSQDFPGVPVINRGFGGSMIADSTFFADRIVIPYDPKLIVFYAGDNDIAEGHSSQQVVDDFKAFVARVRRDLPNVAVAFISIKPSTSRFDKWPQMKAANDAIAAWSRTEKGVREVDVASRMLDADGRPRPELLREDGLHMTPAGYAIWIDALKPIMREYGFDAR